MISVVNYTVRFLFTALFVIIFKKVSSVDISFFKKKILLTKEAKIVLY